MEDIGGFWLWFVIAEAPHYLALGFGVTQAEPRPVLARVR
jgi:hypothetical protein